MIDGMGVWITVDCTDVIKRSLLNSGIAAGNEYRFEAVGWKIIVTRAADLFLEALKQAVGQRIALAHPDIRAVWRMALGKDELVLVPPETNSPAERTQIAEFMKWIRDLLYEKRFVAAVLRATLQEVIDSRLEEKLLKGRYDAEGIVARVVRAALAAPEPVRQASGDTGDRKEQKPAADEASKQG